MVVETNIINEKQKEDLLKRMAFFLASCFDDSLQHYQIKKDAPGEELEASED